MPGAGAGLLPASPHRPAHPVGGVSDGHGEQRGDQVLQLVAGQGDQLGGWRVCWVRAAITRKARASIATCP